MSNQDQKKSILDTVSNELANAKRKAVQASVKKLVEDLQKATEVRDGIIDKIVEELTPLGDDEQTIREFFSS